MLAYLIKTDNTFKCTNMLFLGYVFHFFNHAQFNSTGSSQRKTVSQVCFGEYYPFILKRQICFSGKFNLILVYKCFFTWLDQIL